MKIKAERNRSRKGKDMIAINRLYADYSIKYVSANLEQFGMGSYVVHSLGNKHIRGNCVLNAGYSLKL